MNFSNWFKGYGANKELEFENEKIKKELSDLKRQHLILLDKHAEMRFNHVSEVLVKDKKMASFADEIARLKKLIEESRDKDTKSISTPPLKPSPSIDKKDKAPRGKGDDRGK